MVSSSNHECVDEHRVAFRSFDELRMKASMGLGWKTSIMRWEKDMRNTLPMNAVTWLRSSPLPIAAPQNILSAFSSGTIKKVVKFKGPHTFYRMAGWNEKEKIMADPGMLVDWRADITCHLYKNFTSWYVWGMDAAWYAAACQITAHALSSANGGMYGLEWLQGTNRTEVAGKWRTHRVVWNGGSATVKKYHESKIEKSAYPPRWNWTSLFQERQRKQKKYYSPKH